ncbi:MAG TPA: c-type cytochrome, partial [Gemmatimonadales bacterium]|nr:c-type cytochrome [Gemmatimonadales bacterium]
PTRDAGLTRADAARRGPADSASRGPGVVPGISPQTVLGSVHNPYAGNVAAAATGRQLFVGFNCAGCHSGYAGGGMGPSLRDSLWIYGSSDQQIFSTIAEGRPYGMPAWGGRLPDDLIWKLVTYIRTLNTPAEPDKPPVPSQRDVPASPGTKG